jgi:hypothetical protein
MIGQFFRRVMEPNKYILTPIQARITSSNRTINQFHAGSAYQCKSSINIFSRDKRKKHRIKICAILFKPKW